MKNVPPHINEQILKEIYERLHPKTSHVILKIFSVHLMTAVLTLSICPQFGITFFKSPFNLISTFMIFGMPICNFLCGLFFTTASIVVASFILKRDEMRTLKYNKILVTAALLLSSIGFFSIMNSTFFLELSLLWLIGATMGIIMTLEISGRILTRA